MGEPKAEGDHHPICVCSTLLLPSLFVEQSRLSGAARESLTSGCPGPLCVELQEYGQVSAHLRRYAQGNVTVWLGTEYTTYGLYSIIPQVGTGLGHGGPAGRARDGPGPEGVRSCVTSRLPSQEKLLEEKYSPVMITKAVKNAREQEMLRAAHVRSVPLPTVPCRMGGEQRKEVSPPDVPSPLPPGSPRSGMPWLLSSTCCGWRRQSHRGRWMSFRGLSTSMHFAGQCLPCPAR